MKLQLHLEFDSISEMQDWIVREAATVTEWLTHATDEVTSSAPRAGDDEVTAAKWREDELTPARLVDPADIRHVPAEDIAQVTMFEEAETKKPKRRRRTKAQMEAARAAAGATPDVQPKRAEVDERAKLPAEPLPEAAALTVEESERATAALADTAKRESNRKLIQGYLALNQKAVIAALDEHGVNKFTAEPLDMQAKILEELAPLNAER